MSVNGPSDNTRLGDRSGLRRLAEWVLLSADRRGLTALLCSISWLVLFAIGMALPGVARVLSASDSIDTLFQALLTATLTGVTLVITINQLVLSQELGAAGDQRERMDGALEFREDVADVVGAPVSPARPAAFLQALVEVADNRAHELQAAVSGLDDHGTGDEPGDSVGALTTTLTDSVIDNAEQVSSGLEDAHFGEFDVVASALQFEYSWKLHMAQQIRAKNDETLDAAARDALDELIDVLRLFGPAREHIKTLYFQWALIDLSRGVLLAAIPAVMVSVSMIAVFDSATFLTHVGGPTILVACLAVLTTIGLLPFFVLGVAVLRIATITKRTLSIGPFVLQDVDAVPPVEWDD